MSARIGALIPWRETIHFGGDRCTTSLNRTRLLYKITISVQDAQ